MLSIDCIKVPNPWLSIVSNIRREAAAALFRNRRLHF